MDVTCPRRAEGRGQASSGSLVLVPKGGVGRSPHVLLLPPPSSPGHQPACPELHGPGAAFSNPDVSYIDMSFLGFPSQHHQLLALGTSLGPGVSPSTPKRHQAALTSRGREDGLFGCLRAGTRVPQSLGASGLRPTTSRGYRGSCSLGPPAWGAGREPGAMPEAPGPGVTCPPPDTLSNKQGGLRLQPPPCLAYSRRSALAPPEAAAGGRELSVRPLCGSRGLANVGPE